MLRRCHKRACTETFPHDSMDTGEEAVPALGMQGVQNHRFDVRDLKSQIIWRLVRNQNWSRESTGFGNSVLSSQGGETVDLTFSFS